MVTATRRVSGPRKPRFNFRHISESTYHIVEWDSVRFVGRAYGVSAFVVNLHTTTMVTKSQSNYNRFDRVGDRWVGAYGPTLIQLDSAFQEMLNQMMKHHEMVIARMITE